MLKRWREWRRWNALLQQRRVLARKTQPGASCLHDPTEDDPQVQAAILKAESLADEELANRKRGRGFCHLYWCVKQRILREQFQIEWFSPSDMNPGILFD
jgi:hypothetical protein